MPPVKPPRRDTQWESLSDKSNSGSSTRLVPQAAEEGDTAEDVRSSRPKTSTSLTDVLDLASRPSSPPASPTNRLDWRGAKQWLLLNSAQALPAAKAVLRNIERVSQEHFDNVFAHGVAEMVALKEGMRPLLAVQQYESGAKKSNHWMTEKAHQLAPQLRDAILEVLPHAGHVSPYITAHHVGRRVDLVLFDDAAYSGAQASSLIQSAVETVAISGSSVGRVYVVLGCATQHAEKKIRDAVAANARDRPSVIIVGKPIRIRTLSDLVAAGDISKEDMAILKQRVPELRVTRRRPLPEDELSLTYLPHKMPDKDSVLNSILVNGVGLAPRKDVTNNEGIGGIPFIPETLPPYKK